MQKTEIQSFCSSEGNSGDKSLASLIKMRLWTSERQSILTAEIFKSGQK